MIDRPSATALLALALVALSGCSKTEDSAPDRTIFGVPPVIESASVEVNPNATATCDFTDAFNYAFSCIISTRPEIQGGTGEGPVPCSECGPGKKQCDIDTTGMEPVCYECRPFFLSVPTTVTVRYTQLTFRARVTDPDSTPSRTDILAVTSSFKDSSNPSTPIEDSLVLLDDGNSQEFPYNARSSLFPQNCNTEAGYLVCQQATYKLGAGDPVANDGNYTRAFAFGRTPDPLSLIQDCVAKQNRVVMKAIQFAEVSFQIEAVDRSGNLAAWPDPLNIVDEGLSLECSGDQCFCCWLTRGLDFGACFGLPGLTGPVAPSGICGGGP